MDRVEPLYMLDTNIMSYLMERPGSERLAHCQKRLDSLTGRVAISVIVQAEIFAGLEKKNSNRKELRLRELMREIRVEYPIEDSGFPTSTLASGPPASSAANASNSATQPSPRTRWRWAQP
ncbi:type II toxin-antitoxin system VapC family toxin [Roseateles sp. UC29_93]|uniref:type II toxin-antitoxin system VapC family toxin n=1 Tax=Roseateles sp. UC29_93 TaxID=3350177 RepID=UPI0036703C7E